MKITLSNYNYSYATAVASTLKKPLFKLISNVALEASQFKPWEKRALRIFKLALKWLVLAVFILPAGLSWLAAKSISVFSKTSIDHDSLTLAPPPITIPKKTKFDGFTDLSPVSIAYNIINDDKGKKESLDRLCQWTVTQNENIYPDDSKKRELFCSQLSITLTNIIKKLNEKEFPTDRKRDILLELAEASTRCYPTWLEVATKLYLKASGQEETVEVKLLRLVQEYKEMIILEYSQLEASEQWHALNYVRNILGIELGLNTDLNRLDPYAYLSDNGQIFSKKLTKWLFLQVYENTNRLVQGIQTMIENQEYDPCYHDFLVEIIKQRGIKNPEDYVAEQFFDEDSNLNNKLNIAGVNLMLKSICILK